MSTDTIRYCVFNMHRTHLLEYLYLTVTKHNTCYTKLHVTQIP